VDTGEILNKLKKAIPGSVLETSRFGRSDQHAFWLEVRSLAQVAAFLKDEPAIALDWVENLSAIQLDQALVATYFLRSSIHPHTLILRISIVPESQAKEVQLPTVTASWQMAEPFEIEIQELFGMRFTDAEGRPAHVGAQRLPKGWNGFPLRKNYVFPTQFLGIPHSRKSLGAGGSGR
jgi:NADH:ubiquinone oxidoreductase subunit C